MPLPRVWSITGRDMIAILVGNALFILAMWVRHGGPDQLSTPGGALVAIGQVSALLGTYFALIQLLLMSRMPWLEQAFGMDRLAVAHRWIGFATVWLIAAHGFFIIAGYGAGDGSSFLGEAWTILTTFDFVTLATVGFGIFVIVGITSMRAARRALSYEAWFVLHLLAYLAIAFGFLHQLLVGADFLHDPLARIYWTGLYAITFGLLLAYRVISPIRLNARHRFRVASVVSEGPGVVSIYITGRNLGQLPLRSGQYFVWRFLDGSRWWSGHPFSISSAPNGNWIRTTVKALGDDTRRYQHLAVGTRVLLEGPYGVLTGVRRTRRRVTLIAGGIGVTPLRALVEALPGRPGELTLLYRARHPKHVIFRRELEVLAEKRGVKVHYLVGRRGSIDLPEDPLDVFGIASLVPGIADHDVYVCGPNEMMDRITETLGDLGVPPSRVHVERFAY
ncbi:MAG: ferric reductase-like transmembrane domain-containing protein [Chloroflexi bacterium]|nr:ferric reductase-like transmembrane domain-containing protein [Chloroflexota bacterium]